MHLHHFLSSDTANDSWHGADVTCRVVGECTHQSVVKVINLGLALGIHLLCNRNESVCIHLVVTHKPLVNTVNRGCDHIHCIYFSYHCWSENSQNSKHSS